MSLGSILEKRLQENAEGIDPEQPTHADSKKAKNAAMAKEDEWVAPVQEDISPHSKVVHDVSLTKEKEKEKEKVQEAAELAAAEKLKKLALEKEAAKSKAKKGEIQFGVGPVSFYSKQNFPTMDEAAKIGTTKSAPSPMKEGEKEKKPAENLVMPAEFASPLKFSNTKKQGDGPKFTSLDVKKEKEYELEAPPSTHPPKNYTKEHDSPQVDREFAVAGDKKGKKMKFEKGAPLDTKEENKEKKEKGERKERKDKEGDKKERKGKKEEKEEKKEKKKLAAGTKVADCVIASAPTKAPAWTLEALNEKQWKDFITILLGKESD